MFAHTSEADRYEDVLSVDELEDLLKESPDDLALQEDLAAALVDRVVYGDDEVGPGSEQDIERLRELLLSLAPDQAVFARAYVAYLDSRDVEAARWLMKYASGDDDDSAGEPFSPDELYLDVIVPFNGVGQKFWSELAAGLAEIWPESPAALVVAGYVHQDQDRLADAFHCYDRALQKNADYWIAAWGVAEVYYLEREWRAACHYYERALQSELAREIPALNFQAGYTYGALKKHKLAESYYRRCLKNDSEFPSAGNNLGWALYRQGRFEEALAIFEECIARNVDGDHPRKNKARTLARLGRFAEAVEVWKLAEPNGRLSEHGKAQIAKLEATMKGAKPSIALFDDESDEDDESLSQP
jgi:tetratricopeptide (TPR) repeat protein